MNHTKTNPIGRDAIIHEVQTAIYGLATTWGVELDGYPRCYPLDDKEGRGISYYKGNGEYENLIYAEGNKFFFTSTNETRSTGNGNFVTTKLQLFFIVNATEIYPNITHFPDEEIRADVDNVLSTRKGIISVDSFVIDIEKVFQGYDYRITDDMKPYHAFRVDIDALEYQQNQTICLIN